MDSTDPEAPRTLAQTLGQIDARAGWALAGLALVIVGSIGPWAISPLSSAGGLSGDGKWTLALAAIAGFLLYRRGTVGGAWLAVVILVIGVGDAIHIHHVVEHVTLYGHQIDSVGWGVYAVIVGSAGTLVALYRGRSWDARSTVRRMAGNVRHGS